MYLQLGWRNIWRNRRRTLVILTAVVIGVWSMIFLGALMRGVADQIIRNSISTLTAHIQVHRKGYRNDPVIENSISDPNKVKQGLRKTLPADALWTVRTRVNAIASNARRSTGVTMVGINPPKEGRVSFLKDAVNKGRYLKPDDSYGIIVGEALLEDFETQLGHRLVLMAQDAQQELASRAFEIIGVFSSELQATEKSYVFVTLPASQEMLKLENGISEAAALLPDHEQARPVADVLKGALSSENYEVHTWRELLPMATAILKIYDWFIFLWFLVTFIAMAFGIVNTTLMAVFERVREFGLLKALGMKPWWIVREVLTESFLLLILGLLLGNSLGFLSVFALSGTGIDLSAMAAGLEYAGMSRIIYPVIQGKDVIAANAVVFVLGLLLSAYPAIKAAGFTPVEALAHT